MECRLGHLPLGAMLSTFCGNHALAQQHFRALNRPLFDEVVVLNHKHFADVIGMVQENDVMPPNFVVRDVAILPSEVLKEQNRIGGTELAKREPEQISLEAGRKAVLTRHGHIVPRHIIPGRSCHPVSLLRGLELWGERGKIDSGEFPVRTKYSPRFYFATARKEPGALRDCGLLACCLEFLQLVQLRQHFLAVLGWIHRGVCLRDLSCGIDQKGMSRSKLHQAEIGQ